jgi:tetratricopeptide (TPR) repeat protein
MNRRSIVLCVLLSCALPAASARPAQYSIGRVGCPHCINDGSETSQLLQQADALYIAFKTEEALKALSRVLELDPNNHEALSKSARGYIDLGDNIPETEANWQEKRLKQYLIAEECARRAVKADPKGTWGHFYVAASLGKIASHSSVSKQIDLAEEIRSELEKAIAADPQNGFAYHVYAMWHRRMAEVGGGSRFLASVFLSRTVPQGSLNTALEYHKKALALNPTVISHHLELGKTYIALGKLDLARAALKSSLNYPIQFSDDANHKKEAEQLLREIKYR